MSSVGACRPSTYGAAVGRVGEREAPKQLVGARRDRGPRQLTEDAHHPQVLAAGEVRVDGCVLTGEPDASTHGRRLVNDVATEHFGASGVGAQDRREHAHGRRLARAVRPEEAEDRALVDLQVHAVEGGHVAETLLEALHQDRRCAHARDLLTDD